MLTFQAVKNNNDVAVYRYFPENRGDGGIVSMSKDTGEIKIESLALGDEQKWYIGKMFSKLRSFRKSGTFEEKGMIAWY